MVTQPLPSWICRHARPLTFTIDLLTVRLTSSEIAASGGSPGSGGESSGPSAEGYGASERPRREAEDRGGDHDVFEPRERTADRAPGEHEGVDAMHALGDLDGGILAPAPVVVGDRGEKGGGDASIGQ